MEAFTQAGGHPNFGVTDFKINTTGAFPNQAPEGLPGGIVTHLRTDVAPGLSTNPEAVPKCSFEEFGKEALPGSGLFEKPSAKCESESKIGLNSVVVWLGPEPSPVGGDLPLANQPVYNLVQPKGLSSDFGVALKLPKPLTEAELFAIFKGTNKPVEEAQYYAHTLIEGNVEWGAQAQGTGKADYHDYFEINVSPSLPLISSRLVFTGNIGTGLAPIGSGGFLTSPTSCTGIGPQTTIDTDADVQRGYDGEKHVHDASRQHGLQPASVRANVRADTRTGRNPVRSARRRDRPTSPCHTT